MKKLVIMAALVAVAVSVSATEFGVRGTSSPVSSKDSLGITLGQHYGAFGVEAGFDRSTRGTNNTNKYSIVGGYDVANVYGITITPKVGVAYINPSFGRNGYESQFGVGASYPVMKNVSLVADYTYQHGQDRVRAFNGNLFSVGAKYSF